MNVFRLGTTIFSGILGVAAIWIISVEFIRPNLPSPGEVPDAEALEAHRGSARAAAWIGLIRGNLWTDYAMTLAPDLSRDRASAAPLNALMSARTMVGRAAKLAPYDARSWLLMARVDSWGPDTKPTGPLKMSYYGGPNETSLIPLRINIATKSEAITAPDLQILVGADLRTIITRKPDLKPAIIAAYRSALPEGRRFIEMQVGEMDPGLLASLRATNSLH